MKKQNARKAKKGEIVDYVDIPFKKRGSIIGKNGRDISQLRKRTKTSIWIKDNNIAKIVGNPKNVWRAVKILKEKSEIASEGEIFRGQITKVMDFALFIELPTNEEGFLHISRLKNDIKEYRAGDKIQVCVLEIEGDNKIRLKEI